MVEGSKENSDLPGREKSFVFFRNARPDAFDPETGERYDDVIVIWVGSEVDKQALVLDPDRRTSRRRTSTATPRS